MKRSLRVGRRASWLLAALPWIMGGCAGSLFETKVAPPTLYLLSAARAAPAPAAVDGPAPAAVGARSGAGSRSGAEQMADLAVLKPQVRVGLDNDRIAALYPDRHLDYFAAARWSGPLDEVVQGLVVQFFQARAGLRNVSGDASAFASAYWLEIEVADFQAEYSSAGPDAGPPDVHVHLLARIGSSGDRRIIARFDADARQPAAANRLGAIVDAYERAANQALTEIAAGCATALASETGPLH